MKTAAAKPEACPHIHQWGCVYCGDIKVCSKCMKCPCLINAAKQQLRMAKQGKAWLDVSTCTLKSRLRGTFVPEN